MKEKILLVSMLTLITSLAHAGSCASSGNIKNPDGSVTLQNPALLRGDQTLPVENFYGAGACVLFGFDSYLDGSLKSGVSAVTGAFINADGTYNSTINQAPVIEITCFNKVDFKNAKSADSIHKNPDNSFTIYNPKLLRGNQALPIENFNGAGACVLFGFDSYLDNSLKVGSSNEVGAYINADGTFSTTVIQPPLTEITCFRSGQLTNASEAGNTIYISGQQQDPNSFKQDGITLRNLNQ